MSAINLYTTKEEALYFKDSQRNSFYEFGGIQLLPNTTYTQKSTGYIFSLQLSGFLLYEYLLTNGRNQNSMGHSRARMSVWYIVLVCCCAILETRQARKAK